MAIRTVNPQDAYSKGNFVNAMEDLGTLEAILQGVSQPAGNWNPNFRKKLGDLSRDDERFYAGITPDQVMNDNSETIRQYRDTMVEYAKGKWNVLLGKLQAEDLPGLIYRLPLVKTGNKDLDEIVDAVNDRKEAEEAERQGNAKGYVENKLRGAADWRTRAYFSYSAYNEQYTQNTFNSYKTVAEIKLQKALQDKNGKIDRAKALRLVRESYDKIVADKGIDSDEAKEFRYTTAKAVYARETA